MGGSDDMPQWAMDTVAIVICLAFVVAIMVAVGAVGHCCGSIFGQDSRTAARRAMTRELWYHRRPGLFSHPQTMADRGRPSTPPDNSSVDSVLLASVRPPPPVYVHPPRYQPFRAASTMEQGTSEGHAPAL